jgi:hypothetical protein
VDVSMWVEMVESVGVLAVLKDRRIFVVNVGNLRLFDTMLNFVENLLESERGPMNDQDLTKTDYDPDRSLVLIKGLSHFLTNFLQNLASCQTSFRYSS